MAKRQVALFNVRVVHEDRSKETLRNVKRGELTDVIEKLLLTGQTVRKIWEVK